MAFSLKFIGINWRRGEYSIRRIPAEIGISVSTVFDDPRFREISNDAPGYRDFYAVLSPAEALEIARPYYEKLVEALRPSGKQSLDEKEFQEIETAVRKVDIVVAHVFEWESGLDWM
jgi:hypothetical protein